MGIEQAVTLAVTHSLCASSPVDRSGGQLEDSVVPTILKALSHGSDLYQVGNVVSLFRMALTGK